MKLPASQQPTYDAVSKTLSSRIPEKYFKLLIPDIQTDCDCDMECYDNTPGYKILYLSGSDIAEIQINKLWAISMQKEISEQDILKLLEMGCKNANHIRPIDVGSNVMLCNQKTDFKKLVEVFEKHCHSIYFYRDGTTPNLMFFDFVPLDCVYFLPYPEYLGVITANVGRFGAFVVPQNIWKVSL